MHRKRLTIVSCVLLIALSLACSLPTATPQAPSGIEQTSIALGIQQTSLAMEKATLSAQATAVLPDTPTPEPEPSATQQPSPTTQPPSPIPPTSTFTVQPSPTAVDIAALIRGANVLVYEDMGGYYDRKPLVSQALSEMNFSGGRVINVRDALGNFKEQMLNTAQWDLIIVAAEYRSSVQGEFWQYVYDQVDRGAAVIIEVWYLDQHYTDIRPLLNKCGLEYQKDWQRGANYDITDYAIYWLQPDHPFFQPPQDPVSLANVNYIYWAPPLTDDAGDLLRLASGGDAVLLAGTQPNQKSSYGVYGVCLNGTMIVQTFSTHDYKEGEVVKLWKNAIRYTLTNHFAP